MRERLLRLVCRTVRAKLPLLIWVTRPSQAETLATAELLRHRLNRDRYAGEVFWADTPLFYRGNRGLPRYYQETASRFDRGWVLHNDAALVRSAKRRFERENIRTNVLKDLCRVKGIEGLIFSGSLERAQNYQKAARSAHEFRIYDGEEWRFLNHPSLSGIVSVGANLAARGWQKITCSSLHMDAGRGEYPDRLQQILEIGANISELMALYAPDPVPLIKQALFRKGVLESPRSHRGDADPQGGRRLLEWLEAHPAME